MILKPILILILLILSNSTYSIPHLLRCKFGQPSGYKINCNKSEAIPLKHHTFAAQLPQGMKGINIRFLISKKNKIKRWTVLPLSLWGRAPAQTFLSHISYTIKVSQQWFKEIDKLFSIFLWCDKKPRINRKKLACLETKEGWAYQMFIYII